MFYNFTSITYIFFFLLFCSGRIDDLKRKQSVNRNKDQFCDDENEILPILTRSPFVLTSKLYDNVFDLTDLLCVRTELKILLMSDFDSHLGIPVEANQPLGCPKPLINLTRPAVLRVYYGLSKYCSKSLNAIRPTYGPISTASSVGMDPHNFSTKPMSHSLYMIGEKVRCYLRQQVQDTYATYLQESFNHCTVLVYSGENNNGASNSSLPFHSDCTFDHKGNFIRSRNSQRQDTCVAVLTLGDSRTLYFKKRIVTDSTRGKSKWIITQDAGVSYDLNDNSVFMLNPEDEIPRKRGGDEYISQYIHGGVNITNRNDLSIAFAFRVVSIDREFDPVSCKLLPKDSDLKNNDNLTSAKSQALQEALCHFRCNDLETYSEKFHSFVRNKFKDWKW